MDSSKDSLISANEKTPSSGYQIENFLGKGSFGEVRRSQHIETGESVAMKILEKSRLKKQEDVLRVQREISILMKVYHPNIVQQYEVIENADQVFLVMEYVPNGDQQKMIEKKGFISEKQAAQYFFQLISGVEYIHRIGCAHRDLKPENLLLDENNNIKISDFGLSNNYIANNLLNTPCGSPCFAAPEMITGKKYDPMKVDIWSSGITQFLMLTGDYPFLDDSIPELYKKIVIGQYNAPKIQSIEAQSLIKGILEVDPVKRLSQEKIKNSHFFRKNGMSFKGQEQDGIDLSAKYPYLDRRIMEDLMGNYGIQKKFIDYTFKKNKFNSIRSYYYLAKMKIDREKQKNNEKVYTIFREIGKIDNEELKEFEYKFGDDNKKDKLKEKDSCENEPILANVEKKDKPSVVETTNKNQESAKDDLTKNDYKSIEFQSRSSSSKSVVKNKSTNLPGPQDNNVNPINKKIEQPNTVTPKPIEQANTLTPNPPDQKPNKKEIEKAQRDIIANYTSIKNKTHTDLKAREKSKPNDKKMNTTAPVDNLEYASSPTRVQNTSENTAHTPNLNTNSKNAKDTDLIMIDWMKTFYPTKEPDNLSSGKSHNLQEKKTPCNNPQNDFDDMIEIDSEDRYNFKACNPIKVNNIPIPNFKPNIQEIKSERVELRNNYLDDNDSSLALQKTNTLDYDPNLKPKFTNNQTYRPEPTSLKEKISNNLNTSQKNAKKQFNTTLKNQGSLDATKKTVTSHSNDHKNIILKKKSNSLLTYNNKVLHDINNQSSKRMDTHQKVKSMLKPKMNTSTALNNSNMMNCSLEQPNSMKLEFLLKQKAKYFHNNTLKKDYKKMNQSVVENEKFSNFRDQLKQKQSMIEQDAPDNIMKQYYSNKLNNNTSDELHAIQQNFEKCQTAKNINFSVRKDATTANPKSDKSFLSHLRKYSSIKEPTRLFNYDCQNSEVDSNIYNRHKMYDKLYQKNYEEHQQKKNAAINTKSQTNNNNEIISSPTVEDLQKIFDNNTLRSHNQSPDKNLSNHKIYSNHQDCDNGSSVDSRSPQYTKRKALFRIARQQKDHKEVEISELSINTGIDTSRWEKFTNNSKYVNSGILFIINLIRF